jgi:hypothetical protein
MRRCDPGILVWGSVVAGSCAGLAFAIAGFGHGRIYYAAVYMPVFMMCLILLAWVLYLKDDGFISRPGTVAGGTNAGGTTAGGTNADGLIPRRPMADGPQADSSVACNGAAGKTRRVLLLAALQLGLLAAVLHAWAGVGARYFLD